MLAHLLVQALPLLGLLAAVLMVAEIRGLGPRPPRGYDGPGLVDAVHEKMTSER